uniref:Uncharacterized protein n=1 Tax=uncultured marine virus TaxID=186617 RepID=A0A0F7LA01_9VIRU|nr:hypothetical protein [uncultured marine virus]
MLNKETSVRSMVLSFVTKEPLVEAVRVLVSYGKRTRSVTSLTLTTTRLNQYQ